MKNRFWPYALFVIVLVLALSACGGAAATETPKPSEAPEPTDTPAPTNTPMPEETEAPTAEPTDEPTPVPEPTATPEPEVRLEELGAAPTEEDLALYETLSSTEPPPFDRVAMAVALKGIDPNSIPEPPEEPEKTYKKGDIETFWIHNVDSNQYSEIEAELVYVSKHAYFWVDTNSVALNRVRERATNADWQAAADSFDTSYEVVRAVFGEEASPGIDGDVMLHVLHSDRLGQVGGYFSGPDLLPVIVEEHSNEHEMFCVSISGTGGIASDYYNTTLAHEFQHMIHENIDSNEDSWLNEGLSELAQQIAGMRGDDWASTYTEDLDQSLFYWGSDASDYGHSYLFVDYLYERFGKEFIMALVANQTNGLLSIDQTLAEMGRSETVDEVYSDFMLAVYLNDPAIGGGKYAFTEARTGKASSTGSIKGAPGSFIGEVNQYGGIDVIRITGEGQAMLTFTGAQTAMLIPADAHSGRFMWWSNRGDSTFATLTREVDLNGADSATLTYWTWYDIERDWDYAYVMVSTDGGATWTPQVSSSSSETDPVGANYGHGLTGRSGGQRDPVWVQETVDLSEYAGQTILLRFATANDESLNEYGFAVDDIEISEIGFTDDVEGGENEWVAEGFVRLHNRVPQKWMVRVALVGATTTIQDVEIVDGVGTLNLNLDSLNVAIVFVTGLTRFTTVTAPYRLDLTPQ